MFYAFRGHSLIWPKQVCAAEQCMLFRVLRAIQFHYLVSWTGCLLGPEAFKRVWSLAMSGLHT